MAKTLVVAKHHSNPGARNGDGGCHARTGTKDFACPGEGIAEWLNTLGDDDAPYYTNTSGTPTKTTCGMVRENWIRGSQHIVAVVPELARLTAEKRRLAANLRMVNKSIKRLAQKGA